MADQRQSSFKSYKGKIADFGIKAGSFTDETGRLVDYKQTVLVISYDGDTEEIVLSGKTAPTPKILGAMLRGADKLDKDFLADDQE